MGIIDEDLTISAVGPTTIVVAETERMRLEIYNLRVLVCAYKEKALMDELMKVRAERAANTESVAVLNRELVERYKIDPTKQDIDVQTGRIVDKQPTNFDMLLRKVAQAAVEPK